MSAPTVLPLSSTLGLSGLPGASVELDEVVFHVFLAAFVALGRIPLVHPVSARTHVARRKNH